MIKFSIPLLRLTHVAAIFCFFLPFIPINCNCGVSAEQKAASEKAKQDSVLAVESAKATEIQNSEKVNQDTVNSLDTSLTSHTNQAISPDSSEISNDTLFKNNQAETTEAEATENSNLESESAYVRFLNTILYPDGKLSGLFLALGGIDNLIHLRDHQLLISLSICLFLIIYSLISSFYKSKKIFKRIFISSIIEIICLIIFLYFAIKISEMLYGYWVTLGVCFFNSVVSYLVWKNEPE